MIPGQRPRKRRRTGLPIVVWLLLLALGGVLGWTVGIVGIVLAGVALLGPEAKRVVFGAGPAE